MVFSGIHHKIIFVPPSELWTTVLTENTLRLGRTDGIRMKLIQKSEGEVASVDAMKVYVGPEVQFHSILTLALDEGEWSVSRLGHFMQERRSQSIQ
jgi:hypothetical protein